MRWLQTTGGPFLVLPERAVIHWNGRDGTDYSQACTINEDLGLIRVADTEALVLGSEPMQTAVWDHNHVLYLVRWFCAPSESVVLRHLGAVENAGFSSSSPVIFCPGTEHVVLFDSSLSGDCLLDNPDDYLRVALPTEQVAVHTLDWTPDDSTRLILHRINAADQ